MTPSFFFGGIGAALAVYGLWRWWLISKMRTWTKVSGRIELLKEEKRLHSEAGITAPYFFPKVEVAYEVSGAIYRTSRFSIHNFTIGFPGEARELLQGADAGSLIDIHYDPAAPARSIIVFPSYQGAMVALFLGGLIVTLTTAIARS